MLRKARHMWESFPNGFTATTQGSKQPLLINPVSVKPGPWRQLTQAQLEGKTSHRSAIPVISGCIDRQLL